MSKDQRLVNHGGNDPGPGRHDRQKGKHATPWHKEIADTSTILQTEVGSGVHGTSINGQDDRDEMGVCIEPPEVALGLRLFEQYEFRSAKDEQWRPVVGFEELYVVSNKGRVASRDRTIEQNNNGTITGTTYKGRLLRALPNAHGYPVVSLAEHGGRRQRKVHQLVLEAFAGPCPEGMEACHGPGGQQDNRWPQNLSWGTHTKNMADRLRDGTHVIHGGSRGGSSQFKGVSWHKAAEKWSASIRVDGRSTHLGLFEDEEAAALAYDEAAVAAWGDEAFTNSEKPEALPKQPRSYCGDLDVVVYSLRKYVRLAMNGNPSVLVLLFAPPSAVVKETVEGRLLRTVAKDKIVSRVAGDRFTGYLHAQRRSMLSHNQHGWAGKGRDVTRPELIEKYGYDTKFAGHMVRLGFQGIELMRTGNITLPMPPSERELVVAIRRGERTMDEALEIVAELEAELRMLNAPDCEVSPLPKEPDYEWVNSWLAETYRHYWTVQEAYKRWLA